MISCKKINFTAKVSKVQTRIGRCLPFCFILLFSSATSAHDPAQEEFKRIHDELKDLVGTTIESAPQDFAAVVGDRYIIFSRTFEFAEKVILSADPEHRSNITQEYINERETLTHVRQERSHLALEYIRKFDLFFDDVRFFVREKINQCRFKEEQVWRVCVAIVSTEISHPGNEDYALEGREPATILMEAFLHSYSRESLREVISSEESERWYAELGTIKEIGGRVKDLQGQEKEAVKKIYSAVVKLVTLFLDN